MTVESLDRPTLHGRNTAFFVLFSLSIYVTWCVFTSVIISFLLNENWFLGTGSNVVFTFYHLQVFAQVRLVARGICIHCPNEICNEPFANGIVYLQHVATGCGASHSSSSSVRATSSASQAAKTSSQASQAVGFFRFRCWCISLVFPAKNFSPR